MKSILVQMVLMAFVCQISALPMSSDAEVEEDITPMMGEAKLLPVSSEEREFEDNFLYPEDRQVTAAAVAPLVTTAISSLGGLVTPLLGSIGPALGGVFGPIITSLGTEVAAAGINSLASFATSLIPRTDGLVPDANGKLTFESYVVDIPNHGPFVLLAKKQLAETRNPQVTEKVDEGLEKNFEHLHEHFNAHKKPHHPYVSEHPVDHFNWHYKPSKPHVTEHFHGHYKPIKPVITELVNEHNPINHFNVHYKPVEHEVTANVDEHYSIDNPIKPVIAEHADKHDDIKKHWDHLYEHFNSHKQPHKPHKDDDLVKHWNHLHAFFNFHKKPHKPEYHSHSTKPPIKISQPVAIITKPIYDPFHLLSALNHHGLLHKKTEFKDD